MRLMARLKCAADVVDEVEDRSVAHLAFLKANKMSQPEELRIAGMQDFAAAVSSITSVFASDLRHVVGFGPRGSTIEVVIRAKILAMDKAIYRAMDRAVNRPPLLMTCLIVGVGSQR